MKLVIISGTPGTGKSYLAKKLARRLKFKRLDVHSIIKKISEGYDWEKQCEIIDVGKLNKEIIKSIKKEKRNLIVASHLAHHLPRRYVDLCLITKCSDLKKLKKRLEKRGYSEEKIEENLQCEIFEVCLNEAREKRHKFLVVETGKKIDLADLVKKIKKVIRNSLK